jgi:hypothetical protein
MHKSIYSLAREVQDTFQKQTIDSFEGLNFSMYDTLREIEFMTSREYISGNTDENDDLKPFHDIVTRIVENQRTAEEVDTKDLTLTTKDDDYYTRASYLSKWNQDWMEENNIREFLNDAIETRGKYGGLLVKVVETDDSIDLEVADWTSFAGDAADLESGVKVFNHYYTPAKLLEVAEKRGWDKNRAKEAIELYAESNQDDEMRAKRETKGKYVLVKEVSGVLSNQYLDPEADKHEYSQQMHYIAGAEFQDKDGDDLGKTLHSTELEQSPYYYLPYKKRTARGKTLGVGMVERAKHAQIQTNIAAQHYKDALDLASTHVLQSSSKNLKGKNVLTGMKKGTILNTDDGKPISGVDMAPAGLQFLGSYMEQWQQQLNGATGTHGIATGDTSEMPSNMTYRLGAIVDQNSQSTFDLRREEFATFLNKIYQERIVPFFIKQMKNQDELSLRFSPEELKQMDEDVSGYKADKQVFEAYIDGDFDDVPQPARMQVMEAQRNALKQGVASDLQTGENRRTITDFPDGYWEGVEGKIYVDITGERQAKAATLESTNNVLMQYLKHKPALDQDPNARKLFNNIVQTAGMEPLDFSESVVKRNNQSGPQGGDGGDTGDQDESALSKPEKLSAKPK